MKWYGTLALVFFLFLLAGIVYAGANTDKIGFVIIPGAFATHDPDFNHPSPDRYPITMTLDQETYKTGEHIKISANVGKNSESLVIITLFKPDETTVTSTQMMPNYDGSVFYHFKAGSGNMDVSGIYSIKIEHESSSITRSFSFHAIEDAPFFGIFVYLDNLFSWITGGTGITED